MKIRRTIAIDFDGCLCFDSYPDIGLPNWEIINEIKKEKENGSAIILWTCREGESLKKALKACDRWGIKFDAVNENISEWIDIFGNDSRKIGATEYWDDRSIKKPEDYINLDNNCLDWCGYCENNIGEGIALDWQYGMNHILPGYRYCPMCGRSLIDKMR